MEKRYCKDEVFTALRHRVQEVGSANLFAQRYGFSTSFITEVLRGQRALSVRLARALGFQKIIEYKMIDKQGEIYGNVDS